MAATLFDHIKHITNEQNPNYYTNLSESDRKTWNTYMTIRFLSMNPAWIGLLASIQPYIQELDPPILYKLLISILPKRKIWLKYIKASKSVWYEEWLMDHVTTYFECSKTEARDYLDILFTSDVGREAIRDICEAFGEDPKTIKKLKLGV